MADQKNTNPFSDPEYGKDKSASNKTSNPFSDPNYGKEQNKGLKGHLQDTGASLLKGVVSVPETAVGLLDIPTGGRVGKFIEESTPIQFKQAKDAIGEWHTDQYKEQQQKFNEAGQNEESLAGKVIEKGKVALQNPSMIANTVVESVPSMLAGGAIGRGLGMASKAISPIVGGAVGEGAVMAGAQAENIRYQTDDQLLTPEQSGLSVATGALGSLFGYAGGQIARKLGFDDINTAMASGRLNSQQVAGEIQKIPLKSIPKSIIGGALTEGLLEELPQSVSEQILQNIALNKPLDEGVDSAIVMGTLAGMAMGGGMNTFSAPMNYVRNNRAYNEQQQEQQRQEQQRQQQEQQQDSSGFNQNPDAPNYENGIDYQPPQINSEPPSDNEVQPIEPQQMHDTWSLGEDTQQDYGNSIEFESPESKSRNLESQIQFNNTFGQSTPDPVVDYNALSPFSDVQQPIVDQTKLSERLGINPNDGPMSSAAALAVDSGATTSMLNAPAVTDTAQDDVNNNAPLSSAAGLLNAPNENSSSNESGTGSSSNGPLGETSNSQLRETSGSISTVANSNADDSKGNNLERPGDTALLSNTIGNEGKNTSGGGSDSVNSISGISEPSQAAQGQPDRNNLNTVGNNSVLSGENEAAATSSSTIGTTAGDSQNRTVEPILGADGKNKWFGNQDKAQAFLDKKDLGNDYQVVQDGKRFEIQPKANSPVQDDAYFQSQLDQLDKQRAAFEAVGDDVNATNIYGEMQKVSREWQIASAKNQPGTSQTPKKEYQETESDKAWAEHYRTNRNMIGDDLFEGGHNDKNELKNAPKEIQSRSAHGMSKSTPASAVADLKKLLNDGIDPNRGGGRLFTAPLNNVVANEEERRAASMSGTSSGSSYGDGAFTLVAKQGIGDISNISEVEAVMVNSSVPKAVVDGLRQDFPDMKFGYAKELPSLLSGGKQSNNAQAQVAELEQQLKNEKSVPEKAQIRKQITELQNGLIEQAQNTVSLNQPQNTASEDTFESVRAELKEIESSGYPKDKAQRQARLEKRIELNNKLLSLTSDPSIKREYNKQISKLQESIKILNGERTVGDIANDIEKIRTKSRSQDDFDAWINDDLEHARLLRELADTIDDKSSSEHYRKEAEKIEQGTLELRKYADIKNLADSTQETAPPNAAPNIEDLVSVTTNDGETHMVLASELNDSTVKNLTKFSAQGKRVAVKLPRSRIASTSEQNKQPKQGEATKTEATKTEATKTEATKTEATKTEATPKPKAEVSENRLVSDERAAELRARLKAKLSQLNSGIDPEILAIGAELAVYHIERGARKFAAFAKNIAADLDVSVDSIRPYLRSWYNGARDMMEDMNANIDGMDDPNTVRAELEKLKSNEIEQSQENDDSVSYESNNPESEAAEPVVHVEGKKKEEATSNVVEKSLNKAQAKLESEQYKEMLNGLVSDIQKAIAQAPNVNPPTYEFSVQSGNRAESVTLAMPMLANGDANAVTAKMVMDNAIKRIASHARLEDTQLAEASANRFIQELQKTYGDKPTHITFDVKGDGKFTVQNNKDSLSNFLKKVQSNAGFKPIPKKRDLSTPSFNKINALKAMLSDKDEFTELNAYNMAKASGMPIIFGITNQSHPVPLFVVGQFGEVGNEKLYHTILQTKQGYDNQVSTENGGPLGVGSSEKEVKAKANNHLKAENIERVKTAIAKWNKENGGIQDKLKAEYELYLNNKYGLGSVEENTNEQSASNTSNPQGASAVRGGRGRTSQSNVASGNNRNVDEGVSTGSGASNQNQSTGRSRIRDTGTDVENDGRVYGRGMESSRREDASGTRQLRVDQPTRLESPAAVANTATDFYMADPELIIGGTQVKRFDKNKAALELLEELTNEGRQATTEEQAILAGYTGWGSFGQDLFQGTWDKPVFKDESVWKERNLWLREKLGKESWESAKDSTINAHFTDPYTVAAMWSMAEKMGFTGGRVLEPAIGTGNFISLMPKHIKQRSQVTGIDLDITTAAIAKQLFPESNVQNMPYQKSKTPDNFYDLVISNVPFADIKIADRRYNQFNPNLHDYYFLKMLDQVRPGGIVMAITSSGTMDKQSEVIRRELAKKAELITSVRLPSGAFQEYAGTAVVTDIIVLRKRAEPLAMTPEVNWIGLSEVKTSSKPVKVNSFYAENLGNVLGDIDYGSGTTRFGAGMIVHRPHDLKQRLEKAANFVPEDALLPRHSKDHLTYYANKSGERTNTLTISNGELMFVYGDQMVKATDLFEYKIKDAKKTAQRQKSIEDLIAIRKAYTDLTDAERIEQDNVEQLRKTLNKLYQAYTKEHGPLADSFGLQYFHKLGDAYYYSLAALEVNGKPAEILKRSVVRGAAALKNPTVSDAFVVERNKTAAPSLANIAKLANVSEDQARAELLEKGAVYVLPNGDIMPSDMYLSGNVRLKLEEAQNAVAEGNTNLQRNVDALKEIIPEDIPYFNIEAKMGATWVPLSDYEKYIAHMLGMSDTTGIKVTFPNGKWKVKLEQNASRRTEASTNYGSKYKPFQTIVSAALSNQTITVKYKDRDGTEHVDVEATEEVNERISKIKEDFATWLWSDPERRVQLEKEYNYSFNAWATPKYDGSFMSMQGMALSLGNGPFNLRQHQQNAIWRAIVNRRSINAHEVGTGKTFTMGGIAIESRRYGIAKKPLILAHNANSAAVAKEIQMMYPSARVLFISELGKAVRHIRMRQIANDDWDVVVMPHSMIDKLTLSEETLMAMAADDIAALEAEIEEALAEEGGATLDEVLAMNSDDVNKKMGFKNPTAKQLAKQRLKLLEDIQKQAMDSSKADAVNFEELGVDMIMVDEVHEFKKPSIATRMNMKGLNTSSNKRSVNLQFLTRYVRRMNNGGNVHTFTGTPITNTLTEIYHQMRYVMEEEMQKLNVAAWDGWFGSFATDITDIELSATGEYQLVTRLAGFVNVPELRKMIGQFMDIVFANDMPEMQPRKTKSGKILSDESLTEAEKAELLNGRTEDAKDRPYKKVINVTTEMSPKQEQALAEIQSLAKEWERASGKQKRQWMRDGDPRSPLSISTAAKKASYDARIGDPEYIGQEGKTEDFEMSKASQVVKNVMEVYHSHPLASQVIFADTGYNTTTERSTGQKDANGKTIRERVKVFSPIKDIVERLVQSGIPREQIAIVDGSVKAEARKAIADKMNTGEIRVVIGLTQTLGVGVNMQRNLRAMHHLDAPWMPGELEQRNGRGLRQGNQWNTVLEYRYITDKLDGKSWQVLAIKDRFINSFMKADGNVRSIEGDAAADNGEDNAGDIMSSFSEASGDPRVLQRIKMKEKLEKLQRKERLHTQGIADMKRTIGNTQRRIARIDEQIAEYENNAVLDRIQTLMQSQSENFSVEVDGKKYDKHKEASDAIQQFIVDHVRTGSSRITLGKYGNVTMSVEWDSLQPQATLSMKIGPIEFKGNTLRGIEGKLRGAAQDVKALEDAKVSAQDTINNLSKAVEQPFGQADQLARTQKQLENIEQDLEINPVAPPIWLRRGAPIDSEVYYKGKLFIVSGHRYTNDGWFVSAEDAKGTIEIPYLEATDSVGMQIYEEREFEAPNIEDKTKNEEVK